MKNCQQLFSNSSVISSPVFNCGVWIGDAALRVNGVVHLLSFDKCKFRMIPSFAFL